jgi:hypothetical protein
MATVITRPAPAKTVEVREMHFQVDGRGFWRVDEDCDHLKVEFLCGRGRCPWCGHDIGEVEVPLHPLTGEAMREVIHCPARIQYPWWHTCGRPMLLVPEFEED